jgi:hypothetical protein
MFMFNTGDILAVAGLTAKEFQRWRESGSVRPTAGGGGHGWHCRFSLTQAVGIVVAARLRHSVRGCALSCVQNVVGCFAALSEKALEAEFAAGRTHLAYADQGRLWLAAPKYDWPSAEEAYRACRAKLAEIEQRPCDYRVSARLSRLAKAK